MFEIVPNWHPIFVHFTVGLVIASPLLFLLSKYTTSERAKTDLAAAGRWTLWAGAVASALTVAAGFLAFGSVAHDDPSHLAMTDHRNWAVPTAILIIGLAAWSFRLWQSDTKFPTAFYALLVVSTLLVGMTGLKGADLVYVHGLGVQSLPEVEAGSEGDGHDHEHGEEPAATTDENDAGDGHDHEHEEALAPATSTDHDDSGSAPHNHEATLDTSTPEGVLAAFKAALNTGDTSAIPLYMAEDVLIFESGGAEKSLEDYASHHMGADMAFLANMENEMIEQRVFLMDGYAVILTQSRTFGTYQDSELNINGTETAMLELVDGKWMIKHIHWSSRRAN